jgi:hypothetical protein
VFGELLDRHAPVDVLLQALRAPLRIAATVGRDIGNGSLGWL